MDRRKDERSQFQRVAVGSRVATRSGLWIACRRFCRQTARLDPGWREAEIADSLRQL